MVRDLSDQLGIDAPTVLIFDDAHPRAMAIGPRGRQIVAATTGMVERLTPEQLRAMMAHQLVHLANNDWGRDMEASLAQSLLAALITHELTRAGSALGHKRAAQVVSGAVAPALAGAALRRRVAAEQQADRDVATLLGDSAILDEARAALAPRGHSFLRRLGLASVHTRRGAVHDVHGPAAGSPAVAVTLR